MRVIALFVFACGMCAIEPEMHAADRASRMSDLFVLTRNKNRNEVHYGLQMDAGCRPFGHDPVIAYWLRLEEGPNVTRNLSSLQRSHAYGVRHQEVTPDGIRFEIVAQPGRPILAHSRMDGQTCRAWATTIIGGVPATVTGIRVQATEGGFIPRVQDVHLTGRDASGRQVSEDVRAR